jgi:hypothetical protein
MNENGQQLRNKDRMNVCSQILYKQRAAEESSRASDSTVV